MEQQLSSPQLWDNPKAAGSLQRQQAELVAQCERMRAVGASIDDAGGCLELLREAEDRELIQELESEMVKARQGVKDLEFTRMFSRSEDANNAFLDIQAGSGGTEAQDWAAMLLRMYLKWGEERGLAMELVNKHDGDVAGIKSATVKVSGSYAYGWLRTETGVHRLVRKSPFDSGSRRHTSFAAVFVAPEVDDNIDIAINPADLRIDTFRSSGAGGQHVNTTDSAIRITHAPTGIVVSCQNQRSQHQNRDTAMKQLRSKLYELELSKRRAESDAVEQSKSDIGWGNQIRSYVLDDARVKDLRTSVETSNWQAVLNGNIDQFIEAALKQGLG